MKILFRAVSVLLVAPILIGASAGQASAGEIYGLGSSGGSGSNGRYGRGGCGYDGSAAWGYGGCAGSCAYGGCGSGRCGLSAAGGAAFGIVGDYAPYVTGHGPMFPAGDSPSSAYWYGSR
jgi:hypothetical protein